jgi:hypothetical protein
MSCHKMTASVGSSLFKAMAVSICVAHNHSYEKQEKTFQQQVN